MPKKVRKENEPGGLLTIWLVILTFLNLNSGMTYLVSIVAYNTGNAMKYIPSTMPIWAVYLFLVISLLNLVFAIFLYKWKRWAFYGFCVSSLITVIVNIWIGLGIIAIVGLANPVIIYFLMKPKWEQFN